MSFPLVCHSCGARLKLPPGCTKKKARCPKCNTRLNLTAALDATAYHVDSAASLTDFTVPELPVPPIAPAKPSKPSKPTTASPTAKSAAPNARPVAVPASSPSRPSPGSDREEDPLPYADLNPWGRSPASSKPQPQPLSLDDDPAAEPPLTLDDDPITPTEAAPPPAAPATFRTPAQMNYDSAGLFTGYCEVVLVTHGMFVENVPYRPFLYVPLPVRAEVSGCEIGITIQGTRAVTIEFVGPHAAQIAEDSAAFLAGERPMPDLKEYRQNPKWLLGLALIFALGLAVGPLVLSQTTDLGLNAGLMIAAGFAGIGLLANAAVVLLTHWSVPGKVAVMATVGVLVTGVFLFATTAYFAGRKHESEQAKPEPPAPIQPPPKPPTPQPDPTPLASRPGLPTAVDAAYREGMFQFEEGVDDVTAVSPTPDGAILLEPSLAVRPTHGRSLRDRSQG